MVLGIGEVGLDDGVPEEGISQRNFVEHLKGNMGFVEKRVEGDELCS